MTIQEQKIILRLLSPEQIAEMFPKADLGLDDTKMGWEATEGICRWSQVWYCTRPRNHTGPHVRHNLTLKFSTQLPVAWVNEHDNGIKSRKQTKKENSS